MLPLVSSIWAAKARIPPEHPVSYLNPHDSEELCEAMRSSSMGHLCEWGHSTESQALKWTAALEQKEI